MHITHFSTAAIVVALTSGCAGTQFARQNNAVRIPADGSGGGPAPDSMPLQMMAEGEWGSAPKEKLALTCDARPNGKSDAATLDAANKTIGAWTAFLKAKPKPKPTGPTVGQVLGMDTEQTRNVSSLAFNCAPGAASALVVNGTSYAFDLAWAVQGSDASKEEVSIEALSLKDKRVIFALVAFPKDPKNTTDETIVVSNVAAYWPGDPEEPVVRNTNRTPTGATFETLVFGKGQKEGFYYYVPRSKDLGTSRFMEVGRFKVGNP